MGLNARYRRELGGSFRLFFEHSFSITKKQLWEIKIKAKRNDRRRLSVVRRKNDN